MKEWRGMKIHFNYFLPFLNIINLKKKYWRKVYNKMFFSNTPFRYNLSKKPSYTDVCQGEQFTNWHVLPSNRKISTNIMGVVLEITSPLCPIVTGLYAYQSQYPSIMKNFHVQFDFYRYLYRFQGRCFLHKQVHNIVLWRKPFTYVWFPWGYLNVTYFF